MCDLDFCKLRQFHILQPDPMFTCKSTNQTRYSSLVPVVSISVVGGSSSSSSCMLAESSLLREPQTKNGHRIVILYGLKLERSELQIRS
jgi:hypothetical protein